MRIAFIGKGGSGKSTLSALFIDYLIKNNKDIKVLAIDADLNIHLARYLGFKEIKKEIYLSNHSNIQEIRKYLRGNSKFIKDISEFQKTTPPSSGCNLITFEENDYILQNFSIKKDNLYLMVVGTYQEEDIGVACYHINLSIFENILSFSKENNNIIVADMVAGIDFFANTFFQQFDIFALVVEPNIGNLKIYEHLKKLAIESEIFDRIRIIGNKVFKENDKKFILENFDKEKILGFITFDEYLYNFNFEEEGINFDKINTENQKVFPIILENIKNNKIDPNIRIKKIQDLHLKYISRDSIKKRFGDLSYQIDYSFKF
ncbi:MAG: hypothetical protein NZ866_01095 [Patescibacteria group bacterium]|nr:hypothetical protein [Patescibacteria group bacterium]